MTDELSNSVSVIDGSTNKLVANVSLVNPTGVAFDSSNGDMYVSNWISGSVSVISSTYAVVANIAVGTFPWGVAFDSVNGEVYVANDASNTVSVINGSTNSHRYGYRRHRPRWSSIRLLQWEHLCHQLRHRWGADRLSDSRLRN